MLSMQLSKRFVQQIVLDGFAFVGILNNLLDCYKSQQALKLQQEQNNQERKERSRKKKEAEEQRMFELKQRKKREKHKGH